MSQSFYEFRSGAEESFQLVNSIKDPSVGVYASNWVVVTNNERFLNHAEVKASKALAPQSGQLWTDDYSSIIPLLRQKKGGPEGRVLDSPTELPEDSA